MRVSEPKGHRLPGQAATEYKNVEGFQEFVRHGGREYSIVDARAGTNDMRGCQLA